MRTSSMTSSTGSPRLQKSSGISTLRSGFMSRGEILDEDELKRSPGRVPTNQKKRRGGGPAYTTFG